MPFLPRTFSTAPSFNTSISPDFDVFMGPLSWEEEEGGKDETPMGLSGRIHCVVGWWQENARHAYRLLGSGDRLFHGRPSQL